MASRAYVTWQDERCERLQELQAAHSALEGVRRGRRWKTERVNWSLALLLAAEFQGFARDLHDEAGELFAREASYGNSDLEDILKARLTANRSLDKGNAHAGTLGSDFLILGVPLWVALKERWPVRASGWRKSVEDLNEARNAIAHSNSTKIESLRVNLTTVRNWKRSLDGLVPKMDAVVART